MSNKKYFYGLITNAQELKVLHDEAALSGKQAVGLSRGKNFYIWDDSIGNIRTIKSDEAAKRLGLTSAQIDQIITTNGAVSFEEPEPVVESTPVATELGHFEEIIAGVKQTHTKLEIAPEEPKNEQPAVVIYPEAPEAPGEHQNDKCKCKAKKALNDVIEALVRLRDALGED